jgi:hypothetical protein
VGQEVTCAVRANGVAATARVLLETHAIRVRRPLGLAIPLTAVRAATVDGDWLRIRHADGDAMFELGARAAARWVQRILHPPSRLDKLGVRLGQRVVVLGNPDDTFVGELAARGARVVRRLPGPLSDPVDAVFLTADSRRDLARIPGAAAALAPAGALWIVRLKGIPDITEAETRRAGLDAGLVDVKVVGFSPARTAEKFVVPVARRAAIVRR